MFISDETKSVIQDYLDNERSLYESTDPLQPLFLSKKGTNVGQRLGVRSVEKLVKKYANASAISNAGELHAHSLRASFAMDSLDKTSNVQLVSAQLGHSSLISTQSYLEGNNDMKEKHRNDVTIN